MATDPLLTLAGTYGRYFVADYTRSVMEMLTATYPLDSETRQGIVDSVLPQNNQAVQIKNASSAARFLVECAEESFGRGEEALTPEIWNQISDRPSLLHDEIQKSVYDTAVNYRRIIENMIVGVVAKDANIAHQTIVQGAQARVAIAETGGELTLFDWGILNDGMWLNRALLRAYDQALIFRSGEAPVAFWAQVAFDKAREHWMVPSMSEDTVQQIRSEITALGGLSDTTAQIAPETLQKIIDACVVRGVLTTMMDRWSLAIMQSNWVASSVWELSDLAMGLDELSREIANHSEAPVSEATRERLVSLTNAITLILAGYEALRETRYADSVILNLSFQGDDLRVNVVANQDAVTSYQTAGGDLADLVRFGLYFDPRKGMVLPATGYSLPFLLGRREDVLETVTASDQDRLARLRDQDTAVIRSLATQTVGDVVKSYLHGQGKDVPSVAVESAIYDFAREMTAEKPIDDGEIAIARILLMTFDDPVLTEVSTKLFDNFSQSEGAVSVAIAKTIASMAAETAVDMLTADPDVE